MIDVVPLPPMPADPRQCRWCGARMVAVLDLYVCTINGCTPADQATWDGFCLYGCRREFQTGSRWHLDECWQCRKKDMDAQRASALREPRTTGYEADRRAAGANRRAVASLHGTPAPVDAASTAEKVETLNDYFRTKPDADR